MSWINQKQCWGESWADVQGGHASYNHSYTDWNPVFKKSYLFFAFDYVNNLVSEAEHLRLPFYGLSFTSQGPLADCGIFCKVSMTDDRFSNAWVFHQLIGEWNSLDKDRMVPKGKNIHELSLLERFANSCSKSHWTLPTTRRYYSYPNVHRRCTWGPERESNLLEVTQHEDAKARAWSSRPPEPRLIPGVQPVTGVTVILIIHVHCV